MLEPNLSYKFVQFVVKNLHVSQVSRVSVINIRVDTCDTPEPNYSCKFVQFVV